MSNDHSIRRPNNFKDLTGQTFGEWTVLRFIENAPTKARWLCRCSCGKERPVRSSHLNSGGSMQCKSCSNRKSATRHGGSYTPEFRSWKAMRDRCYREQDSEYRNYGGRGVVVCDRWRTSFEAFRYDMGPRPKGTTLDRIDNDGHYEPGNCRWATHKEQGRNRRTNVVIEHNGRSQCLSAWAEELGISGVAIRQRITLGWSIADAVTLPPNK